jgi:non-specific serine/threonine protein kinase/serine/threonine-protein kinase
VQARRGAWSYRAGRFVLRHRAAVGAALVANLLLVAGVTVAGVEAYEAHQQKQRAERHFDSVRRLANVFVFDVHKAIETLPGATPARKLIVQNALTYLEQLSAEAQDDAQLLLDLAAGYRQIGDIQGGPLVSNLGDPKGARASYERAAALVQRVLSRPQPRDTLNAARRELAQTARTHAALLATDGDFKGAQALARAGIDAARAVDGGDEASKLASTRLLAGLYQTLAQVLMIARDDAGFEAASAEGVRQLEALYRRFPDEVAVGGNLATMYGVRSQHLLNQADPKRTAPLAMEELNKAIRVLQALQAKHPDNVMLSANLAVGYDHLGGAYEILQRPQDAVAARRRSVEILAPLVAKDPSNMMLRVDYATFAGELSQSLRVAGDIDASVKAARDAVQAFDDVPEQARDNVISQFDYGYTHFRLASALEARAALPGRPAAQARADHAAACASLHRSAALFKAHEARFGPNANAPANPSVAELMQRCGG